MKNNNNTEWAKTFRLIRLGSPLKWLNEGEKGERWVCVLRRKARDSFVHVNECIHSVRSSVSAGSADSEQGTQINCTTGTNQCKIFHLLSGRESARRIFPCSTLFSRFVFVLVFSSLSARIARDAYSYTEQWSIFTHFRFNSFVSPAPSPSLGARDSRDDNFRALWC